MKTLTLILALVLALPAAASSHHTAMGPNPILEFIANFPGVKQVAVYSLITNRCSRYLELRSDRELCHEAVAMKLKHLNFDLLIGNDEQPIKLSEDNPHSFIIVAFKHNLYDLLNDPVTLLYLDEVKTELTRVLDLGKTSEINLWDITVKHFGTDIKAARAISALFQDTSPVKMHLLYLKKSGLRGGPLFAENLESLSATLDTIHLVTDYAGDNFQQVFYPRGIKEKLNRGIYHFYVPMYLSMALLKDGIDQRFSFLAPLMMTLSYEFISSSSDYTYLFSDPESLNPKNPTHAHKIRDIFAGYMGAKFGTGKLKGVRKFKEVGEAFEDSTFKGVELLLSR